MAKLNPQLSNGLARARKTSGLTQEQLAMSVDVSRQTVGAIEKGEYNPSTLMALRFAGLLGVTVEELFWLDDGMMGKILGKRVELGVSERRHSDAPEDLVARAQGAE
jgi:putative transcriptional regulator